MIKRPQQSFKSSDDDRVYIYVVEPGAALAHAHHRIHPKDCLNDSHTSAIRSLDDDDEVDDLYLFPRCDPPICW